MNGDQPTQTTPASPSPAPVPEQSSPVPVAPPAVQPVASQKADDTPLFVPPASPLLSPPQPSSFFHESADEPPHPGGESLSWSAATSIIGHKPKAWFFMLIVGSIVVAGGVYLLNKDIVSSVAIVLASLLFGAYSTKKPRAVQYLLDGSGITVDMKHYVFAQFRSFSIVDEGAYLSIALAPLQRFSPLLSISYDPQMHDRIINILSSHLPLEDHKKDAFDQITSRIKF